MRRIAALLTLSVALALFLATEHAAPQVKEVRRPPRPSAS